MQRLFAFMGSSDLVSSHICPSFEAVRSSASIIQYFRKNLLRGAHVTNREETNVFNLTREQNKFA
jgi:hypothetical protein